jgi:hypothetical protein
MDPVASTSLTILGPFVRYFPTPRMFYLQLTWGMLLSSHRTVTGLTETVTNTVIPDANIVADIALTTMVPTVSVGYFFWRRFFFFNVNIGATFLLNSTSTVKVTSSLPVGVGSLSPAEEASLKASLDRGLADAVTQFRNSVTLIPSLMLSTGVMF